MIYRNKKTWGVVMGASLIAASTLLTQAKAELVYDDQAGQDAPGQQADVRVQDRESLRQVIQTSQKNQITQQTQVSAQPQYAQPQVVYSAQAEVASPTVVVEGSRLEVQNLSKSELMRRERLREEMKNEDAIQTRLEELRLRDERSRADQVMAGPSASTPAPAAGNAVMQEQIVAIPVTERPASLQAPAPEFSVPPASQYNDQMMISQSGASAAMGTSITSMPSEEEKTSFWISPKGGVSSMNGNLMFNVKSRFTAGLGLGVGVSDHLAVEAGYAYSEYGVGFASGGNVTFEDKVLRQNLFEMGMKFHLLGKDAKFRPFVGGGGGYSMSFLNYDQRFMMYNPGMSPDYETSAFLGFLSAGFDVKVSKSVSIGAAFKYYSVLSSRQNQNLYNLGYGMYGASAISFQEVNKQMVGASLADSSFHSVTVGATFAL
jgi:outer membrane protein W